ncbi:hypothetical protein WDU94_005853 [Cyamophila willieti]
MAPSSVIMLLCSPSFQMMLSLMKQTLLHTWEQQLTYCTAVLANKKPNTLKSLKVSPKIITPKLNKEQLENVNYITGIHMGTTCISWALLHIEHNTRHDLLEWNHLPFPPNTQKLHIHELSKLIFQAKDSLPESDLYVTESMNPVIRSSSNPVQQVALELISQLQSMLCVALSGSGGARVDIPASVHAIVWHSAAQVRSSSNSVQQVALELISQLQSMLCVALSGSGSVLDTNPKLVFLKNRSSAKLFNLLLKSESITSRHIMENIFQSQTLSDTEYYSTEQKSLEDTESRTRLLQGHSSRSSVEGESPDSSGSSSLDLWFEFIDLWAEFSHPSPYGRDFDFSIRLNSRLCARKSRFGASLRN